MLPGLIAVAASLWLGQAGPGLFKGGLWPQVVFRPQARAVSNWRLEAAAHLDAAPGFGWALLLGRDPAAVTRCVRLNNYWCIKRAGWAGEIAADREGHVAFASALEGADVAALLLRRYYIDYNRRSAFAIVSRWAPAACAATTTARPPAAPRATAADHLAVRGIRGTLRARFLAARRGRVAGPARLRASVVPDRLIGRAAPAPSIALGLGETRTARGPVVLGAGAPASLPLNALAAAALPTAPPCTGDVARIRAYAARAAAGIAPGPNDDLKLFDASGRPTPNLARLMRNMAAVEIGPLGVRAALIEAAVRQAEAVAARRAAGP